MIAAFGPERRKNAAVQVRAAVEAAEPDFSSSRTLSNTEYFVARDLPAVFGIDPEGPSQAACSCHRGRACSGAKPALDLHNICAMRRSRAQRCGPGSSWSFHLLTQLVRLHVDDRGMAGRYVHMFSSNAGFEGEVAGMGAYMHEDGTYTVALQAGTTANCVGNYASWCGGIVEIGPTLDHRHDSRAG